MKGILQYVDKTPDQRSPFWLWGVYYKLINLFIRAFKFWLQWVCFSLEELLPSDVPPDTPDQPDCASHIDLEFSMRTFPHLQVTSKVTVYRVSHKDVYTF